MQEKDPWSKPLWHFFAEHLYAEAAAAAEQRYYEPCDKDEVVIYGLLELDTMQIRYIGWTSKSAPERLKAHCDEAMNPASKDTFKNRWLRKMLEDGREVVVLDLLRTHYDFRDLAEQAMIWSMREEGFELTNGTVGGSGGYTGPGRQQRGLPPTAKQLAAWARRKGQPSPNRGMKQSPETIQKRKDSTDQRKKGESIRKFHEERKAAGVPMWNEGKPAWNRGQTMPDETREKVRQAALKQAAEGRMADTETRQEAGLRAWETRRKRLEAGELVQHEAWNKGMKYDPARAQEISDKMWATRRASDVLTQKEMIQLIANKAGCSLTQAARTLKTPPEKPVLVRLAIQERIWDAYEVLGDEVSRLKVFRQRP